MTANLLRKIVFGTIVLIALILLSDVSNKVSANLAAPSQGGNVTGEPSGLEEIYITNENLTIDFRPLGDLKNVTDDANVYVEAVYDIENKGEEKELKLVFAVGSQKVNDFQILFDDIAVAKTDSVKIEELPEAWRPPDETPWLEGKNLMYYPASSLTNSVSFSLVIPPGKHIIKTKYTSEAAIYRGLGKLRAFQFAYILAPAREWAGFGGLQVKVFLPKDWTIAALPELEREGEILKGNFAKIPADSLGITVQPPMPANHGLYANIFSAIFIFSMFGVPLCFLIYGWFAGFKLKMPWLTGIGFGFVWALSFCISGYFASYGADNMIPAAYYSSYGYGDFFDGLLLIFFTIVLIFAGFGIWMLTVYFAKRRFALRELN